MTYSVIIVNYNAGTHLIRAVKSGLALAKSEVIVVDNASTDHSLESLRQLKSARLKIIANKTNLGFAKANNQAAKIATQPYLVLLNPDAELNSKALSELSMTLSLYHDQAIIAPALVNSDGSPQPSCYRRQNILNAFREFWGGVPGAYSKYQPVPSAADAYPVDIAVAAVWLLPKHIWDRLGGLSEKYFLYFEDLDFCDRARQQNIPVIYQPKAVIKHIHGVSSESNSDTAQLFSVSANSYHGRFSRMIIDFIIRSGGLWRGLSSPKKTTIIWLTTAILTSIITALGYFLLPMRYSPATVIPDFYKHNFLFWSAGNFDGEQYLNIAANGYQIFKGQSQYAFFPFLPFIINLFNRIGIDYYLSARITTLIASIFALHNLAKWSSYYTKKNQETLWTYLLSSGGIFLYAIYTEPIFLAIATLTFLAVEEKKWGRAILATALATATRINGVFLAIFLVAALYRQHKSYIKIFFASLLSCSGLFGYMIYLYTQTGNFFAWYTAQSGWGKAQIKPLGHTLYQYLLAVSTEFKPDLVHLVVIIEVLTTLTLFCLYIYSLRIKIFPWNYHLYLLGNLILPLMTGSLGSMPRFALTLFPLYLIVQHISGFWRTILRFSFLICWILGIILFTRGYWYA